MDWVTKLGEGIYLFYGCQQCRMYPIESNRWWRSVKDGGPVFYMEDGTPIYPKDMYNMSLVHLKDTGYVDKFGNKVTASAYGDWRCGNCGIKHHNYDKRILAHWPGYDDKWVCSYVPQETKKEADWGITLEAKFQYL